MTEQQIKLNEQHLELTEQQIELKQIEINNKPQSIINGLKKLVDITETISKTKEKYNKCRSDPEIPIPHVHCLASSISSTIVEKTTLSVGHGLMVKGGAITATGLVPEPAAPVLLTAGTVTIAGGSYLVMKSESWGNAVYNEMINNYKKLYKRVNPPTDVIVISPNNEYFKLNLTTNSTHKLQPISRPEALDLALSNQYQEIEQLRDDFKSNIRKLEISRDIMTNTKSSLDFKVNTTPIKDINKPVELVNEANNYIDLSYEKINEYIKQVEITDKEISSISARKIEYTPIHYPVPEGYKIGGCPSGSGSSGGGFIFLIPVFAIPLGGGCCVM